MVRDGKFSSYSFIEEGGSLTIDLGSYQGVENIQLELFVHSKIKNIKNFDLHFKEDALSNDNSGFKTITLNIPSNDARRPSDFLFKFDSSYNYNFEFGDWVYVEWPLNTTFYRQMQYLNLYRYKDTKYRYYKMERTYLKDYYTDTTTKDYVKDESSAKIFYLYGQKEEINNLKDNKGVCVSDQVSSDLNSNSNSGFINNVDAINNKINKKTTLDEDVALNDNVKNRSLLRENESKLILNKEQQNLKNMTALKEKGIDNFYYTLMFISIFIIIILIIIYLRVRHQNLSHQK
jgi:hypothetical protein